MSAPSDIMVVLPCYNEAARLDPARISAAMAHAGNLHLLLVDDGSRDRTLEVLRGLAEKWAGRVEVLPLPANVGKAEAVRQGVLRALGRGFARVGYFDADLATPLEAAEALSQAMDEEGADVVLGSRVKLLGRDIERSAVRHYVGRVCATCVSVVLRLPVYDTQCGAKLFRATGPVRRAFATPFETRWIFDVEILARLLRSMGRDAVLAKVIELPLRSWRDVPGSKIRPMDLPKAALDLVRIARYLRARPAEGDGGEERQDARDGDR